MRNGCQRLSGSSRHNPALPQQQCFRKLGVVAQNPIFKGLDDVRLSVNGIALPKYSWVRPFLAFGTLQAFTQVSGFSRAAPRWAKVARAPRLYVLTVVGLFAAG